MKRLLAVSFFFFYIACSPSEKREGQVDRSSSNNELSTIQNNEQAENVVINFLKWYRDNYKNIDKINLVNNSEHAIYDSTKFYSVNFEATEKYLSIFKKSGYISDKYIDQWRQYFKKCEEKFKRDPENDGPPSGFDFDLVMWSQDYDEDLADLNKVNLSIQKLSNYQCNVIAAFESGMKLRYSLTQVNRRWLIDDIQNNPNK